MTTADQAARRDALLAAQSTATLVTSARVLEEQPTLLGSERLTLAWVCDELAKRGGGLAAERTESDAFDALLDTEPTYLDALLAYFPELPRG